MAEPIRFTVALPSPIKVTVAIGGKRRKIKAGTARKRIVL